MRVLQKGEADEYVGQKLSLDDCHGLELGHRMTAGWVSSCAQKEVLWTRRAPFRDRTRLLNATVAPAALHASVMWTLSAEQERRLRTTRRKKLRKMVGAGRSLEQSCVEYIQRVTRAYVLLARRRGAEDWPAASW
eukprot:1561573-Pyramimonas_sp.AAC.1